MQHATHGPFCAAVQRGSGHVKKACARADQDEARVFLIICHIRSVLENEMMSGELSRIERPNKIDINNVQVWLLGALFRT
jgi:hypothetical protein